MDDFKQIHNLLSKPLWQMTGAEFCTLTKFATRADAEAEPHRAVHLTGVHALADYLHCCDSTVFMLRRNGVLDDAIVSQIGKKIVFDGEKARAAADKYQKERRSDNE